MTEPTDVDLWGIHVALTGHDKDPIEFARAVLAKWGQSAQAVEPVSQPQKNAIRQAFDEVAEYSANEWRGRVETAQLELEVYRKAYQTLLEQVAKGVSIMRPPPLVISAPQPVAREPLTDEHIRAMLNKHPPEDVCGWSYRMGIDDAELHHGIKGGQHDR